jgi:hypothetical protein
VATKKPSLTIAGSGASGDLAKLGTVLACVNGDWTSRGDRAYAYAWLRNGVAIADQVSDRYRLREADLGKSIACRVTATNDVGSTSSTSSEIGPIKHFDLVAPSLTVVLPKLPTSAASWRILRVRVADASPSAGIKSVKVRLVRKLGRGQCMALVGARMQRMTCAKAGRSWTTLGKVRAQYQMAIRPLARGTYTLTVQAADKAGNTGTAEQAIKIVR